MVCLQWADPSGDEAVSAWACLGPQAPGALFAKSLIYLYGFLCDSVLYLLQVHKTHTDKDHGYDLASAFLILCGEVF